MLQKLVYILVKDLPDSIKNIFNKKLASASQEEQILN